LLAHGQWFSPGTPASSTTKTGRHDKAEILLKMALNTKNKKNKKYQKLLNQWSFGIYFSMYAVIVFKVMFDFKM
jgi:hypothetical protein